MVQSACANCGSKERYRTSKPVSAGGGYAPNYLPGLGRWRAEKFFVVVCRHCGLTQLHARREALDKLAESSKWERI